MAACFGLFQQRVQGSGLAGIQAFGLVQSFWFALACARWRDTVVHRMGANLMCPTPSHACEATCMFEIKIHGSGHWLATLLRACVVYDDFSKTARCIVHGYGATQPTWNHLSRNPRIRSRSARTWGINFVIGACGARAKACHWCLMMRPARRKAIPQQKKAPELRCAKGFWARDVGRWGKMELVAAIQVTGLHYLLGIELYGGRPHGQWFIFVHAMVHRMTLSMTTPTVPLQILRPKRSHDAHFRVHAQAACGLGPAIKSLRGRRSDRNIKITDRQKHHSTLSRDPYRVSTPQ